MNWLCGVCWGVIENEDGVESWERRLSDGKKGCLFCVFVGVKGVFVGCEVVGDSWKGESE